MADAWFEYNGRKSTEFGIRIENDISYPSPEADVEELEIIGRDGTLYIDNERLKSMPFPIPIRVDVEDGKTLNQMSSAISGWLKGDIGLHPFRLSTEPDKEYKAIILDGFNISETIKTFGRTVITFKLEPAKMVDAEPIMATNGMVIQNEYNKSSKPIIHIIGTGNIEVKNNGKEWLKLRSVDDNITIDSETKSVYRADRPQYKKMVDLNEGSFPLLNPGDNKITWTGNIEAMEIQPRWEMIS